MLVQSQLERQAAHAHQVTTEFPSPLYVPVHDAPAPRAVAAPTFGQKLTTALRGALPKLEARGLLYVGTPVVAMLSTQATIGFNGNSPAELAGQAGVAAAFGGAWGAGVGALLPGMAHLGANRFEGGLEGLKSGLFMAPVMSLAASEIAHQAVEQVTGQRAHEK